MLISNTLKKEFMKLNSELNYILKSNIVTDYRLENFLKQFEKSRFNILNEIQIYNENVEFDAEKISTIDTDYKAQISNKTLNIYVPETLFSYKNIKAHNNKRLLLNIASVTKDYKDFFSGPVVLYIKVFDKQTNWDIDNRSIKPISDGLIASEVIKDDKIDNMFYCVRGFYSEIPHTEIQVFDAKNIKNLPFI